MLCEKHSFLVFYKGLNRGEPVQVVFVLLTNVKIFRK